MLSAVMLGALVLLGAVCGLDVVSFPQAMISRPIIASTLGGAVAGNAGAGLVLGAVLELIALETLPFGASRYPEWGSAAVVGGGVIGCLPARTPGALVAALVSALVVAGIGSLSMVELRRLNGRWAHAADAQIDLGSGRALFWLQMRGLVADFLRAALLTLGGLLTFRYITQLVVEHWHVPARTSHAMVVGVAATVAVGAVWKVFHGTRGAAWMFCAGLAIGLAFVIWRYA